MFITNRALSATNNGSERALLPCAVYRKITNGFRSEWAAVLFADTRSVIETGRRRSVRAIDAIRLTLCGNPISNIATTSPEATCRAQGSDQSLQRHRPESRHRRSETS